VTLPVEYAFEIDPEPVYLLPTRPPTIDEPVTLPVEYAFEIDPEPE
jgi:hypothetical protein